MCRIVTGAIFGLLAVGHVYELVSAWQAKSPDYGFLWALAGIILLCGTLSAWAFRLLRGGRASAA